MPADRTSGDALQKDDGPPVTSRDDEVKAAEPGSAEE